MTLIERIGPVAQSIVSLLVILAFGGVIAALLMIERDFAPGVRDVLLVLVGVLAGAFKDVVGYWIGSSLGSARKDELKPKAPAP